MTNASVPTGGAGKQGFDSAYERLAESGDYQTEFAQLPTPEPPQPPPDWLVKLLDWFSGTGDAWSAGFWIVAIGLAAIILFFIGLRLVRYFSDRVTTTAVDEDAEHWRPEEKAARSLLADADALAGEGRYAEAVHLLLHRSIDDIRSRLPNFLKPALTSRDIADAPMLPAEPRGAFASIAQIVERGIFAQRPVDESGWGEARQAYERFAFGEAWR
ncbi:MAG: hypothetical protein RLN87_06020 [Parasphingopyxis sp.]|uniref:hypothetical protein n=1 Tax=Parasphingopyxis sp. TaxID=1920299 RepID=UPI0032ED7AFC